MGGLRDGFGGGHSHGNFEFDVSDLFGGFGGGKQRGGGRSGFQSFSGFGD